MRSIRANQVIAILFGLAMDYAVVLVTRAHERFVRSGDALKSTVTGFRPAHAP